VLQDRRPGDSPSGASDVQSRHLGAAGYLTNVGTPKRGRANAAKLTRGRAPLSAEQHHSWQPRPEMNPQHTEFHSVKLTTDSFHLKAFSGPKT
jgi:hypothetical protein